MKQHRTESFSESTTYLVLVKALSFLPLILLPLLARSETSSIFTQVMLALTIDRFVYIVYEFGSHIPNITKITYLLKNKSIKDSTKQISLIFCQVKLLRVSIWLLSILIIYSSLSIFELSSINRSFLYICLISGLFRVLSPIWFFLAIKQLRYQFFMALLAKLICFIGVMYLFFKGNLTGLNYLIIFAFSDFVGFVSGLIYYFINGFKIIRLNFVSFKQTLKESINYCLERISLAGYNFIPPIILGFINPTSFIFFSLSERIYSALQSINSPIMDAIFAHRISDSFIKFRTAFFLVFLFSSVNSLFIFIFSDRIITFLFGNEYLESAIILKLLCITFVIQALGSLIGHPFLTNKGYGFVTNNSVTIALIICFVVLGYFSFNQSLSGLSVAIILLFTEFMVLVIRLIYIFWNRKNLFDIT